MDQEIAGERRPDSRPPGPRVSIVIPTFNRADMLPLAVESCEQQEHFDDFEIIVVDDGSADDTPRVMAELGDRIVPLRQTNQGIGGARNAGVRQSCAPLLAFLDDDNLWTPGKLHRQLEVLDDRAEIDVVYGHIEQFHDEHADAAFRDRYPIKTAVGPAVAATAGLFRREAFDRVGPFNDLVKIGVEVDWQLRAAESGLTHAMLPEVVCRRRIHPRNTSILNPMANRERLLALKRSLDRRRSVASSDR